MAVAAVWTTTNLGLAVQSAADDAPTLNQAVKCSSRIASGHRWRIFAIYCVLWAGCTALNQIVAEDFRYSAPHDAFTWYLSRGLLYLVPVSVLVISAHVVLAVIYVRLRHPHLLAVAVFGIAMAGCRTGHESTVPAKTLVANASSHTVAYMSTPETPSAMGGETNPPTTVPKRPEEPSPFFFAAIVHDEMLGDVESPEIHLHDVGSMLLAASGKYLVELHGDEVVPRLELVRPMKLNRTEKIRELVGSWPNVWAVIDHYNCVDGEPCEAYARQRVMQYAGRQWLRHKAQAQDLERVLPTGNAQLLVASTNFPASLVPTLSRVGKGADPQRRIQMVLSDRSASLDYAHIVAMAPLPGGRILVGCEMDIDPMVERVGFGILEAGKSASITFEEPACGPVVRSRAFSSLAIGPDGTVTIGGSEVSLQGRRTAYIGSFDGQRWHCQSVPELSGVGAMDIGTDGTLWAVAWRDSKAVVFSRSVTGAMQIYPLPGSFRRENRNYTPFPRELKVVGNDDVWIATTATTEDNITVSGAIDGGVRVSFEALLHNRRSSTPIRLPNTDAAQRELIDSATLPPATEGCPDLFVLLHTIGKRTPRGFDYPLTRQALKGHAEFASVVFVEGESLGRRYLGANVRDLVESKHLAAVIAEGISGASPTLACGGPPGIWREFRFNLATAAMLP